MTPQQIWDEYRQYPWQDMWDYAQLLRTCAHGSCLEIGVRDGVSTSAILLGLDDKQHGSLVSVDREQQCGSIFSHPRWSFLCGDSHEIELPACKFDFMFIDGGHSYDVIKGDLKRFTPLLKHGGTLLVHDVQPLDSPLAVYCEGAPQAWREFVLEHTAWQCHVKPGMTGMGVALKI